MDASCEQGRPSSFTNFTKPPEDGDVEGDGMENAITWNIWQTSVDDDNCSWIKSNRFDSSQTQLISSSKSLSLASSQIRLGVPIVTGTGSATAGTENALVHPIRLSPILLALENLLSRHRRWVLPLQPGLFALVLIIEIGHVHQQGVEHHETALLKVDLILLELWFLRIPPVN
ncbi:hypothetical protein FNV43_RR08419 [Rhamnella rubrinervis]|uniref:Uncharacterized protein n=1 Tax=Rhamnella rubrinervis TaxID=2594499 RepID=A0A8K0H8J5_9ROSA|nr:hypothetical protein FNV43_RR08419 [Rhamnella rubrinervis]